ncbi:uncharacterized protein LOC128670294 [Plodia interpunctella]|uniref:uncharacterized protein LOC128670294 n=1 Tax=Plodia interpunctella TaxID=58824 RepID=UPI002368A639|nr:uncharacterized protein LOC128670294 [Plodia interpunctella]
MKIFLFAYAIFLAGVNALPGLSQLVSEDHDKPTTDLEVKANERFVDGIIVSVIEGLAQDIRDAGLDPINIDSVGAEYRLPVTDLFNVEALAEDVISTGLSDFVIEHINYGVLTSRLRMTLVLPRVFVGADTARVNGQLLGWEFNGSVSGSLAIVEIRVRIDVRINIGIISGVSIRSIDIDFSLGGVESNLNVNVQGSDLSEAINNFAGNIVPTTLANNRAEINELLEYIILQIA